MFSLGTRTVQWRNSASNGRRHGNFSVGERPDMQTLTVDNFWMNQFGFSPIQFYLLNL